MFLRWLASKLNIRLPRFLIYIANWKDRNFVETRGKSELLLEVRQNIYDTWVENSIMSTECRNGQNVINISKHKYFLIYDKIQNRKGDVEEKTNKRGHVQYQAYSMFLTCTAHNLFKKF